MIKNDSCFKLLNTDGKARAGVLKTTHGEIPTPIFMPVGTKATVKALTGDHLEQLQAPIILGNTYHLYLRPGHKIIEQLGGLHQFMNWQHSILTDSGGFQVFSLSDLNKVTQEGVHFRSHIDGSPHFLTPELSMEIQKALGSDIVMCFDECPALPASKDKLRESMELTLNWAQRCRDYALSEHQLLFGIVQGGLDWDLRMECLERLNAMGFEGLALGGFSVGEAKPEMHGFLNEFTSHMPAQKPRYLMGVGTPLDLLQAVRSGVDMFDCVMPTRNARNGQVFTTQGPINVKRKEYELDQAPIDESCTCFVCEKYTKAYLRHLYTTKEPLSMTLLSYHNLHFYLRLMHGAREAILNSKFDEFYQAFYNSYVTSEKK